MTSMFAIAHLAGSAFKKRCVENTPNVIIFLNIFVVYYYFFQILVLSPD